MRKLRIADDLRPFAEGLAHLVIDNQIHIALPISEFDILQAMILLRSGRKFLLSSTSS